MFLGCRQRRLRQRTPRGAIGGLAMIFSNRGAERGTKMQGGCHHPRAEFTQGSAPPDRRHGARDHKLGGPSGAPRPQMRSLFTISVILRADALTPFVAGATYTLMVRRALALFGALSLVLSPGAVGLLRAFASLDPCGCNMGADCPMCKARRAHDNKKNANCPCRLQQHAPAEQVQSETPPLDLACLGELVAPSAPAPREWSSLPQSLLTSWSPQVPHPPPRAA